MTPTGRDPSPTEQQAAAPAVSSRSRIAAGPASARGSAAKNRLIAFIEPHRGGRFAALDGYRAVAALGVVVFHVGGAPTSDLANNGTLVGGIVGNLGNFGVATFFLLSGFLLYRPFVVAHFGGNPAPDTVRFYRHRLIRIVPAFWVALTGWFLLVWSNLPQGHRMSLTPDNLATVYGFAQIYRPLFGFAALTTAWTLCIEITFYLVLPGIAWAIREVLGSGARSLTNRLRAQLLGIGALMVIGWIYRLTIVGAYAVAPVASGQDNEHLWLPNFFDWFGLGMLLAVAVAWRDLGNPLPRLTRRVANLGWLCWSAAGVIYLVVVMVRGSTPEVAMGANKETLAQLSVRMLLNGLAAFFFLLPGILGTARNSMVRRGLATAVPAYLGTISYGIYLWHKVWLDWLLGGPDVRWGFWPMLAAVLALTVVVASVSWFGIERPLMRFKDPSAPQPRGAAA